MSLSLSGFVVGDRMLGKKLRFVDIVCIDILGPVEPLFESLSYSSKDLRYLVFVNNTDFSDSQEPFPRTNKAIRIGDLISVEIQYTKEKKAKVSSVKCKEEQESKIKSLETSEKHLNEVKVNHYVKAWKLLHRQPSCEKSNSLKRQRQDTKSIICKTWLFRGKCPNKLCAYRHFVLNESEENSVQRRLQKQRIDQDAGAAAVAKYRRTENSDGLREDTFSHSHDENSKRERSRLFAEWLIDMFGVSELQKGTGVLDVAGGKGYVSLQLLQQTKSKKLKLTVIDPLKRKTLISRKNLKVLKKLEVDPPKFLHHKFDPDFANQSDFSALVNGASVIFGMHPDQATGYIVETALEKRKAFAVVPCCVFANDFPERKVSKGKLVETVDDLIEWIKIKCKEVGEPKTGFLPMEGKNKIVYMREVDYFKTL